MQFKVGDCIVHPYHGVGHIVRLSEKYFSGEKPRVYYEVNTTKSTIWIPVEGYRTSGLRLLTAKNDLARYRRLLTSRPAALDKDYRKRHLEYAESLKRGSFQIICEIVRDLTAQSWRKSLGEGDSAWLRKARSALYEEWAASSGISLGEAMDEVEALLLETRKKYLL